MRGRAVLLSDVHLNPGEPAKTARLVALLETLAADPPERLGLLGDLFHFWVGAGHDERSDFAAPLDALARLAERGVAIDFVHGNRDFLVGGELARRLGGPVRLVADEALVQAGDTRFGIAHGDLLCGRDTRYRAMRRVIRSRAARGLFARLALPARLRVAGGMRSMSEREVSAKAPRTLSLAPSGVRRLFRRLDDRARAEARSAGPISLAVVGHVHRAQAIALEVDGVRRLLVTLGAWDGGDTAWAEVEAGRIRLLAGPGGERSFDAAIP